MDVDKYVFNVNKLRKIETWLNLEKRAILIFQTSFTG